MKKISYFAVIIFSLVNGLLITACNNDDDNSEGNINHGEFNVSDGTKKSGLNYAYYFNTKWILPESNSDSYYGCLEFYTFDNLAYFQSNGTLERPSTISHISIGFKIDANETTGIPVGTFELSNVYSYINYPTVRATDISDSQEIKNYSTDECTGNVVIKKNGNMYTVEVTNININDVTTSKKSTTYTASFNYTGTITVYPSDFLDDYVQ